MTKPVLWQIKVSHYSEKIRWALEYKGVDHERKSPPPGAHMAVALAKSRGASKTFPLLELDGTTYSDSTDIVAALEERWPEPPLYPSDPAARARALELEDFFDEEVGPYTRLYAWHEIVKDRPTAVRLIESGMVGPSVGARQAAPLVAGFLQLRYGVKSEDAAREARAKIDAGFDRIEAELGDGEYLVGDAFTVADAYLGWALRLARFAGLDPNTGRPALAAYRKRVESRPSMRDALAAESPEAVAAIARQPVG